MSTQFYLPEIEVQFNCKYFALKLFHYLRRFIFLFITITIIYLFISNHVNALVFWYTVYFYYRIAPLVMINLSKKNRRRWCRSMLNWLHACILACRSDGSAYVYCLQAAVSTPIQNIYYRQQVMQVDFFKIMFWGNANLFSFFPTTHIFKWFIVLHTCYWSADITKEWAPQSQTCRATFFVIGARKGGTTSLYYYLTAHPNILPYAIKRMNFVLSYLCCYNYHCHLSL